MLREALEDLLGRGGAATATRIIVAVLVLILTWAVRRLIGGIVPRVVRRLTQWTNTPWNDRLAEALLPPLRLLVGVAGLGIALLILELPADVRVPLVKGLNALIAFTLFWAIYRLVDPVAEIGLALSRRARGEQGPTELEQRVGRMLGQVGKALVLVLGFAMIIESWGYDVAGLVAGLGIGGLAVALAAQDTLANLLGYFVIQADEPLRVGEYVVFGTVAGTVEHIGFRSTRIRQLDQSLVTVPNNTIMNASIINWSRLNKRRLNMTLGLSHRSAPDQILSVVQAIRDMLQNHPLVQADSVVVQFVNFSESALDLMIICFMQTPAWGDFQAARQDINLKIMHILAERGVELAFPTRTIHVARATEASAAPPLPVVPLAPEPTTGTATDSPVPDDAAN